MNELKVSTAASDCIAGAIAVGVPALPFVYIRTFIGKLRPDAGWTAAEIKEVETRVVGALMHRLVLEDEDRPPG